MSNSPSKPSELTVSDAVRGLATDPILNLDPSERAVDGTQKAETGLDKDNLPEVGG